MADTVTACRDVLHTTFGEANTAKMLASFNHDFDEMIRGLNVAPMAIGAVLVQVIAESMRDNPQALILELVAPGAIVKIATSLVVVGLTQPQENT
jgi:hypothetical protein